MAKIENFDTIISKYIEQPKRTENHFLAPQGVFRLCIIGPSGSGKTNILLNLLLKYLYYDKIYLYAKDLEEDKYRFMQEFFEALKEKLETSEPILTIGSSTEDIVNIDEVDPEKQNIIIFDDFVTEKNQKKMEDMFIRGRKKNCSIIYLSQTYFKIPKSIRLQSNYFILTNISSKKEIAELQKDHALDIDKEKFYEIYRDCVSKPFSFMLIDRKTQNMPERYRRNFNGFLID